ncbi:MAG TPA: PqqD family protein [Polyangia bacterium]
MVVDPQGRRVFSMNSVAGVVWSAVERGASEDEMVAAVVRDFRIDEARARCDVDDFLRRLEALGLAVRQ